MPFPSDEEVQKLMGESEPEKPAEPETPEKPAEPEIEKPEPPEKVVLQHTRRTDAWNKREGIENLNKKIQDLESQLTESRSRENTELREQVARLEGQLEAMQRTTAAYAPKGDAEFDSKLDDFEGRAQAALAADDFKKYHRVLAEQQKFVTEYTMKQNTPRGADPQENANRAAIMGVEFRHPEVVSDPRGKPVVLAEFNKLVAMGDPDSIHTLEKAYKNTEKLLFPKEPSSRHQQGVVAGLTGGSPGGRATATSDSISINLPPEVKKVAQDLVNQGFFKKPEDYYRIWAKEHPESVE